jgi:hypothetical protein
MMEKRCELAIWFKKKGRGIGLGDKLGESSTRMAGGGGCGRWRWQVWQRGRLLGERNRREKMREASGR